MSISNGYLTLAEAKADLGIGDTDEDVRVERAVQTASRLIDRYCGQRFWEDGSDTTRYFTPANWRTLRLASTSQDVESSSVTAVTSVAVDTTGDGTFDETFVEGTDFFLSPRSAAEASRPYTKLELLSTGGRCWPVGHADAVKIVGTFGWPAVPDEVKEACAVQAQVLFKRATEGAVPIVTMDGTTLSGGSRYMDREAELLLANFRLPRFG